MKYPCHLYLFIKLAQIAGALNIKLSINYKITVLKLSIANLLHILNDNFLD